MSTAKRDRQQLLESLKGKHCEGCGFEWTSIDDLDEREPVVRGNKLWCSKCKSSRPKTETVRERAIYVYPPSLEMTHRWKQAAKEAGTSISKFIVELVEDKLMQETSEDYQPRAELLEEVRQLKEENAELRKQNRMLDKLVERLDDEVKSMHAEPFTDDQFKGFRKYQRDLVDLIQTRGTIRHGDIFEALDIDPKDTDVVKAINRQLEHLERYGIIKSIAGGYRWNKP